MISVLSAIEGLQIATPVFTPYVVAAAVLVNWRDFRLGLPLGQGVGNAVDSQSRSVGHAIFGMPRGTAAPSAKLLYISHRKVVTGEEQQAVEQHAGMPGGQHKAIAIGPLGVGGIVPQMARPQHVAIGAAPKGIPGCPSSLSGPRRSTASGWC